MKIYVAGPMTGVPEWNIPAFSEMTEILRDLGHEVVNPHELHAPDPSVEWATYLKADIPHLLTCDVVVLLEGWEESRGARLENVIAYELGLEIVEPANFEEWINDR